MRHVVFLIAYLYFLYTDIREKKIELKALILYALVALVTMAVTRDTIGLDKLVDIMFSIAFGLIIYLLSYFSEEGIGLADGMYFVINGFLLSLKENIILFLTGLLVAFIIGVFLFYFKSNQKSESRIPFMPCFLPAIVGYIICIA